MIAVGAIALAKINQLLIKFGDRLHLAMDNCPNQVILFGSVNDIAVATEQLQAMGAICTRLPFDRAYHTSLFAPVGVAFRAFYDSLNVGAGHTTLYSCATSAPFPTDVEAIRNLATQQWSSRVRFRETVLRLYEEGVRTFIEVGPSGNLTGFVSDILAGRDYLAIASNNQKHSGLEQIQNLLGRLFVNGHAVDFSPLYRDRHLQAIDFDVALATNIVPKPQPILALNMPIMRLSPDLTLASDAATLKKDTELQFISKNPIEESAINLAELVAAPQLNLVVSQENFEELNKQPPKSQESQEVAKTENSANGFNHQSLFDEVLNSKNALSTANYDSRLSLINAHFQLMADFLANQERVTNAIFSHFGHSRSSLQISEQNVRTFAETWPLLGKILEKNEQYLYCERRFEMGQDLFLHDHTIGGVLCDRHPELLPLPLIPFTVSMEILAEAAAYLVGGNKVVTGISNLRGYRWLSLDQGHLTLNIKATLQPQPDPDTWQVQVRLFLTSSDQEQGHLVFEGIVNLADSFAIPPTAVELKLTQPAASRWTDAELYSTGMFHGPRFQGVKHIHCWGKEGIEADLQVISIHNFFHERPNPTFQIDAGLLDAVGQLVGYWVSEQFGSDFNVFPFQVKAFDQYTGPLPAGSQVRCRATIKFIGDRQAIANFDCIDSQGRLIARIEAWQDRCFTVPEHYYHCRLQPSKAYLSRPWLQTETNLFVRRIDPFPEGFFSDAWRIWLRVLAHLVLNQNERDFWYNLSEQSKRRIDWLLGRIAAKDAVRQWAEQTLNLQLAPVDIEVGATSLGQPIIICAELEKLDLIPQISITHSHEHIVAVLSPPNTKVGIDLQRLEKLHVDDLLDVVVKSQERKWLDNLPTNEKQIRIVEFWCAKEAAAKALGIGLNGNPKNWEICAYLPEKRTINILYAGTVLPVKFWRFEQEVFAICCHSQLLQPHFESTFHLN